MKNGMFILFIIFTLGFNIYSHYRIDSLYMVLADVNQKIGDLKKEPIVCTIAFPDGTIVTRPVHYDEKCRREDKNGNSE